MENEIEQLYELLRITKYRDGCIWRTSFVRDVWVTETELRNPPADHLYAPWSTSRAMEYQGITIRRRKQNGS